MRIQGATLHDSGGIEIGFNGRFIQIAMGQGRIIESSYTASDARKLSAELNRLAKILEARRKNAAYVSFHILNAKQRGG